MRVAEAEARLREMLAAVDVETQGAASAATARRVWDTYKRFAAEPIDEAVEDPDADMLIFVHEAVEDSAGEKLFRLILTRQFIVNDRGDYDHMEHLQCMVWCQLTSDLEQVGFEEGVFLPTATHLDEWISDVEHSLGFAALLRVPTQVDVRQEHV